MSEEIIKTLNESKEPSDLKRAALTLAKSDLGSDHESLGKFLASADFLGRLDSVEEYQSTYTGLRLARVFKTLMDKRMLIRDKSTIDKCLLNLTSQSSYHDQILRVQLLVHSLAVVKPSPPPAIAYWTKYSEPNGLVVFDIIQALCENQSGPAMGLLLKRFEDESHDKHERIAWMQQIYLTKRNDIPLLRVFEKLITGSFSSELKIAALEATFDYKPEIWYVECDPVTPPPRIESSPESRKIQESIAQYAVDNIDLSASLYNAVATSMLSIGIKIEKLEK